MASGEKNPTYYLQVWDGERYRDLEMSKGWATINAAYERHIRSMPNCPCRVQSRRVVVGYLAPPTSQEREGDD